MEQKEIYAYRNEYNSRKYDRISFFVPKGMKDKIKKVAQLKGVSVNKYITDLLPIGLIERETEND